MAYKHVIKVNDVCQLVPISDKADGVVNGVTFTNNRDGTWTLSGTSTAAHSYYNLFRNIPLRQGHIYLKTSFGDISNAYSEIKWINKDGVVQWGVNPYTADENSKCDIGILKAQTNVDTVVLGPQLFDLTEMFGSGNEPATVAEFREKFPNDYYPYTPYNYLQSNKRMIKVSNVCQLLDKSKYPATHTQLGCTFTNNGDGSFTINGTIQKGGSWSNSLQQITQNLYGHKILFVTKSTSDIVRGEMKFTLQNGSSKWGTYNSIYTVIYDDYKYISIRIYMDNVDTGKTIDNATVKFQLFDLTEMFGAGHEPTTVAEFRQRFPNEYYPYSPQCWLTSYKSAVVCKTKNLFDVNNAVPYTFTNDNPDGNLIWLKDGIYTTRLNNYNIGSGLRIKDGWTLPAGTYTVSAKIVDFYNIDVFNIGFRYKDTESKWHAVNSYNYPNRVGVGDMVAFRYDIPEHTDLRLYLNYQNNNGAYLTGFVSYKDIQIEQGSTATSYVPYQHL